MNPSTYQTDCHPTLVLINTSSQMLKTTAVFEDINQGSTVISHFLLQQYNDIFGLSGCFQQIKNCGGT